MGVDILALWGHAGLFARGIVIVLLIHLSTIWTAIIGVAMLASALFVATRPEGPRTAG